jgi:zinc protease
MESIHHAGYLNELPRLWKQVSAADLVRIVKTYFAPDMRTVGVLRRDAADGAARVPARSVEPSTAAGGAAPSQEGKGSAAEPRPALNAAAPAAEAAIARDVSVPPAASLPDPLAIAEHPWNAPPWLAARRPSRFEKPAPTLRHTSLTFPDTPFSPPAPDGYLHRLTNGLRAYVVPEPLLPMAQFTLFVDAPAIDDPAGKEGRASLLASILRRTGTQSMPRAQFEAALDRLNATLTIAADHTGTRLRVVAPPQSAAEALALVAGLVTTPDLASVFDAERDRLAVSAGRATDAPAEQARLLFDQALYGRDHVVARRPSPASVRAITIDDVRRLHQSRYRADHMTIAISGRVDRAAMEKALAASFGSLPAGAADEAGIRHAVPKVTGRTVVTRNIDIRQGHVLIGHAGIEGTPEDHAALEVMNYILSGGGFVSRMMKLLRTDTGITSALSGSVAPGRGVVNPYLWRFSGAPETIARGVRLSLEQIGQMREGGVTEEEFQAARTAYVDGLVPASYETAHEIATRLASRALFGLYDYQSPQYLNYYAGDAAQLAALRQLTRDDVNRAARKYLDPANIVIAIAGPMSIIQDNATPEERGLVGK